MKALLIFSVLFSGCSLFDDVGQITFRNTDAGVDAPLDVIDVADVEVADVADDLDAQTGVPDVGEDVSFDVPKDVEDDVELTGCARDGCLDTQFCDPNTNTCADLGSCAEDGCPGGLICDNHGQCVTCTNDDECGPGATCTTAFCRCDGAQNYCARPNHRPNACVTITSIEACGATCQTCPEPPQNADAICGAADCDFACRTGFIKRGDECVSQGIYCNNPGGQIGGVCDPVAQTGCSAAAVCSVRAVGMNSYERVCTLASTLPLALEGEDCTPASGKSCEPAHACVLGVCRRFCDTNNAAGCGETQYCAPAIAPTPGLGFCNDDCSLTD